MKFFSRKPIDPTFASLEGRLGAMIQVASGLRYLHKNEVAHRDLAPTNILVCSETLPNGNRTFTLKITDFGDAAKAGSMAVSLHGTPNYQAPEIGSAEYDPAKADIFSLGHPHFMALWRLEDLTPAHWTPHGNPIDMSPAQLITFASGIFGSQARDLVKDMEPALADLIISQMLLIEPLDRLPIDEVLGQLYDIQNSLKSIDPPETVK